MRKSMFAAVAATTALTVGLVAPATGGAAKVRSKSTRAAASGDLTALCNALGLKPLLDGLEVNLSPLIRIRLSKVCE